MIFVFLAFFGNLFLTRKSDSNFLKQFKDGSTYVHFIDVGQGDCSLIFDKDRTVLIDCGEVDKGIKVARYLKKLGIKKIDYFIATHPHTDHIGGFVDVARKFDVENVIMPKIPDNLVPTNPVYEQFLSFLKENRAIKVKEARVGEVYGLGRGKLQILGPLRQDYDNLNDFSVVCRFDVGSSSFLFAGDAQKAAEHDLIKSGQKLKANVFKLNHHGSRTSNTKRFLKAVGARIYIASVGRNNPYHHPHVRVLNRILKSNRRKNKNKNKIYRTDLNGSVVFRVDGESIKVNCER